MNARLRDTAFWVLALPSQGIEFTQPTVVLALRLRKESYQIDCAKAEDDGDEGEGVEDRVQRVLLGARRRHEQTGLAGKHHYGLERYV